MIEKVIFCILAFAMFIIIFGKVIKKRDSIYIYILSLDFVGIVIRFVSLSSDISSVFWLLSYIFSIVLPFLIILLESKKVFLPEMFTVLCAKMYLKLHKNDLARKKLIKYIDKHYDSYYAHKLLAQIYEKEGKYDNAIDEYVIAVDINSKDYDSYYQIAYLLNKTEKIEESKNMLMNLLSKKPEYYKASELLGSILYDQEQFKEAVNIYLQALKYNPARYELYYGLGMAYTRLNDFQTAKEYYEKAAKINSMLYHAKVNIAQIMLIEGELEEAENRFIECLEDKDSEPDAYFYLAIISMLKGEIDRAVGYVNIAIELDRRMYKRVCKQEIFLPIMDQIRTEQTRNHRYHLTYQELKTRKYLDDTFSLINKIKDNGKFVNKDDDRMIKGKDAIDLNQREY